MRIESISPIMYTDHTMPVSSTKDTTTSSTSASDTVAAQDFNSVLKQCVSELSDQTSQKPVNSLAEVLGYDEDMVTDLLTTSDGKQKLAQMAANHLTDVVLTTGSDDNDTSDTSESLIDALKESTGQKSSSQELQDTFESLASIYNRTIKQAPDTEE